MRRVLYVYLSINYSFYTSFYIDNLFSLHFNVKAEYVVNELHELTCILQLR